MPDASNSAAVADRVRAAADALKQRSDRPLPAVQARRRERDPVAQVAYTRLPADDATVLTTPHPGAAAFDAAAGFRIERIDEQVMLNKAVMSKFGIRLGEVTLAFRRK